LSGIKGGFIEKRSKQKGFPDPATLYIHQKKRKKGYGGVWNVGFKLTYDKPSLAYEKESVYDNRST
jgi:hypothetical protein